MKRMFLALLLIWGMGAATAWGQWSRFRRPAAPQSPRDDGVCKLPDERMHNTDWFSQAGWGVFVHYLETLQNSGNRPQNMGKHTSWDECVKEFDTEKFADQVQQTGAHYAFFTAQQGTRFVIAPNATYDQLTGYKPGEACSTRDLIEDLYQSLHKRGIPLMLYWTGDGPHADKKAADSFGGWNNSVPVPYVEHWAACAADYGNRYGDKIAGWWCDGCLLQRGWNEKKWAIMAKGLRAGNSKRIIALNSPNLQTAISRTLNDDYTTGEANYLGETSAFRWRNGVQWHLFSWLGAGGGEAWASPGVRYSPEWLTDYIRRANFGGGVITIEVMLYRDSSIEPKQLECLKKVGANLKAFKTNAAAPPGNLAFGKPANHYYADGHQTRGVYGNRYAMNGVDGNPDTVAQGADKGPWAYAVDLETPATVERISVTFGKQGIASHFKLIVSEDGKTWNTVSEKTDNEAAKVEEKISPVKARYVRVVDLADAKQSGKPMLIGELEVYGGEPAPAAAAPQ